MPIEIGMFGSVEERPNEGPSPSARVTGAACWTRGQRCTSWSRCSALNVHPHDHLVGLDSVFGEAGGGEISFHGASELTTDSRTPTRSDPPATHPPHFPRRGVLDEIDAAGMLTWQGAGGFSVDASVRIEPERRAGKERLVRYCARRLHSNAWTLSTPHPLSYHPRVVFSTTSRNPT
jgi:hypothetical protein